MEETNRDELTELILNELDLIHADGDMTKKIMRMIGSGKAYLEDKFGAPIDYEADRQALELLISYCRYARSSAIEQFPHDFLGEITALAIRGAMKNDTEQKKAVD